MSIVLSTCSSEYVPIRLTKPPEDLLTYISGGCSRWQIYIGISAFLMIYFHGLNIFSGEYIVPTHLNYHCENSTWRCLDAARNPCKKFVFPKNHLQMNTINQELLLLCDRESLVKWVHFSMRMGMICSYVIVGFFADRFGEKVTTMLFLPFMSLAGLLIICSHDFMSLILTIFIFGVSCTAINLLSRISLCNIVGNKWRTFALGFTTYPIPLAMMTLPYIVSMLSNFKAVTTILSMSPLVFLIPLLAFQDSPSWMFVRRNVDKAEKVIRTIARFNGMPMSNRLRVRPVEVIEPKERLQMRICQLFEFRRTRNALLALLFLWFSHGFVLRILCALLQYIIIVNSINFAVLPGVVGIAGCVFAIGMCHLSLHKHVIAANIAIAYLLIAIYYLIQYFDPKGPLSNDSNFVIKSILPLMALFFYWTSYTALDNATPRMFSTDVRSECTGVCLAIHHLGQLLAMLMTPTFQKTPFATVCVLVIFMPSVSVFATGWVWTVHGRELPDFVEDAVRFQKYYKPTRFISIEGKNATMDEKEVKSVMFE